MALLSAQACVNKYGEPGSKSEGRYMSIWLVPADIRAAIPAIPARIYCNNDLRPMLEKGLRNLMERGYAHELKTWDGCYVVRKQRGYSAASLHSWGAAFDVNAATNGLGKKPTLSAGFVKCFTDAGLHWGGTWSRPDGMHFQQPG